eukprot:TRINITY_DN222_c0_g1_i5.p1 TRINITY_DN222_c0_g1~~TRINITY_DN222_c0_g1_i5.p1  ORF type:complete len:268 (-),score=-6.03 TRINITY_DN222_c0_g1_i5:333-1136(-)
MCVSKWAYKLFWSSISNLDFTRDESVKFITWAVANCDSVKVLKITSYSSFSVDKLPTSILNCLSSTSLRSLTSLSIQRWSMSTNQLDLNVLSNLTHLTLISDKSSESGSLPYLTKLESLTLRFVHNSVFRDLHTLTNLQTLNVGNLSEVRGDGYVVEYVSRELDLNDESVSYLHQFTNLKKLNLCGLRITDAAFNNISNLSNLRSLDLVWCSGISDPLSHISKLSSLTSLAVWKTGISDDLITKYKKALPHVHISSRRKPRYHDVYI